MKSIERHSYKGNDIISTRRLVFNPYSYSEIDLVIELIQNNLTPDLLKNKKLMYPGDRRNNKYYGHCYHSTQALYYLIDTDQLVPMSGEDYRGEKHWWLQVRERILDVTSEQYYCVNESPPYNSGKKSKWYGWKQRPQQITINLMKRVLGDRTIEEVLQKF
tara:strand:+ start:722 stop:1204 length:483 start_codon:yes stop_codon:yes gene_type:complete